KVPSRRRRSDETSAGMDYSCSYGARPDGVAVRSFDVFGSAYRMLPLTPIGVCADCNFGMRLQRVGVNGQLFGAGTKVRHWRTLPDSTPGVGPRASPSELERHAQPSGRRHGWNTGCGKIQL